MPSWTLSFLAAAATAALLGFGADAGAAAGFARACFFFFVVLSILSLFRGQKPI